MVIIKTGLQKIKQIKNKLVVFLLCPTLFFLTFINHASAANDILAKVGTKAVELALSPTLQLLRGILYIGKLVATILLGFAGGLLDAAIQLSTANITNATIVQTGAAIVRDVANMFFLVAIIIIAFATILRIPKYGIKETLPKLLLGALLINFSVVLAGPFIDLSHVFTKYFASALPNGFSQALKTGWNIGGLYNPNDNLLYKIGDAMWASFQDITELILANGVILVAAFVFAAGALFLVARVIYLWILLIISPIIWVCWALPATEQYWTMWWKKFLQWVFFAPVYLFFLYISALAINGGLLSNVDFNKQDLSGVSGWFITSLFGDFYQMLQYLLVVGLLIGALLVANSAGVLGASAAMGLGKKWGLKARDMYYKRGKQAASVGTALTLGGGNMSRGRQRIDKALAWMERVPLVGRTIGGPGAQRERQAKDIEERKKKFTGRTNKDIDELMNLTVFTVEQMKDKIALLSLKADKNKLSDKNMEDAGIKTEADIQKILRTAESFGLNTSNILDIRPDWSGLAEGLSGAERNAAIAKRVADLKIADAQKVEADSLKNEEVAKAIGANFKSKHYDNIASNNVKLTAAIQESVINKNLIADQSVKNYLIDAGTKRNFTWTPHASWERSAESSTKIETPSVPKAKEKYNPATGKWE